MSARDRAEREAPPRVLLVDDDEDTRDGYALCLRMAGVHVDTGRDGADALHAARTRPPDVIIMDIAMPGMDGWQAIDLLKSHPRTRSIPVLAVSAHLVDSRTVARARAAGFTACYRKPCPLHTLVAAIRSALVRSEPRGSAADDPLCDEADVPAVNAVVSDPAS